MGRSWLATSLGWVAGKVVRLCVKEQACLAIPAMQEVYMGESQFKAILDKIIRFYLKNKAKRSRVTT
jgi:hypothetical protein